MREGDDERQRTCELGERTAAVRGIASRIAVAAPRVAQVARVRR
ncbi:MAG: hypothetical protein U1F48_13835 [Burkholderiales bacterium]